MIKLNLLRFPALCTLALAASGFAQLPDSIFGDTNFHPIFNKRDFTGWQAHSSNWSIRYPGTDSASIRTDSMTHSGTHTHLIYNYKVNNNIEMRAVMRFDVGGGANAGLQFRSRCQTAGATLANNCGGTPWGVCGPQADIAQNYTGDIYNGCTGAYVNNGSASAPPNIVNNTTACRAGYASVFRTYHSLRYRVYHDTVWTFLNDVLCSKYLLTSANDVQATSQGIISLQHETRMHWEIKSLELKNLDGSATTKIRAPGMSKDPGHVLESGKAALTFDIGESGRYSVKVADVNGKVLKTVQGMGPVSRQNLSVGTSGLFIVKISSLHGTTLQKAYIY